MNKFIKLSKIGTCNKSDFISDAPIQCMHNLLNSLFVDRFEVEKLLFHKSKRKYQDSWQDVVFSHDRQEQEYQKYTNCYYPKNPIQLKIKAIVS